MESNKPSKSRVIFSLIWKMLERGGAKIVQLIVQLILTRILSPEDFGTIAIILVFINLAQIFIQSGLNTALIQKKDTDNLDFSSALFMNFILAIILYGFIFIIAPRISTFYHKMELIPLLRVLSLTLFPGAVNSIQNAYVSKNMQFKQLFYSSLGSYVISGIAGIYAAFIGMGTWALVIQNVVNQFSLTIIMWFTIKWRPTFQFSLERIKQLFSFAWKLLLSGLLSNITGELRTLIIGRINTSSELGYYNKGNQIPTALVSSFDGSIQAVMLPTLSSFQDNEVDLKRIIRRSIKTSSFFILPMMVGLVTVAEPLVLHVMGEKWLPAVPFLRIFCIAQALSPIQTANVQVVNAIGRSDIYLKLEVIKDSFGLIVIVFSVPFGIYAIAIGQIVCSFVSAIINAWPNKNLINYSFSEQLSDILPAAGISILMGACVYLISYINMNSLLMIVIQIVVGIVIYMLLAKVFKLESATYISISIKDIFTANKEI